MAGKLIGLINVRDDAELQIQKIVGAAVDAFLDAGIIRGVSYGHCSVGHDCESVWVTCNYQDGQESDYLYPASLIEDPTPEAIAAYKAEKERKGREAAEKRTEQRNREYEDSERQTLAQLIAKYGVPDGHRHP